MYEAIVIGASAGGIAAVRSLLSCLPRSFVPAVVVVQHLHPGSRGHLAQVFDQICPLPVSEAEEKERVLSGHVYLAPPDYHLLIEEDKTFSLSSDRRENFSRPSIDVLFESAADVYGPALVGCILTGANKDGSAGLRQVKERGGLTIVQDPGTADMASMPRAAIAACPVDYVLPLGDIGPFLAKCCDAGPSGGEESHG